MHNQQPNQHSQDLPHNQLFEGLEAGDLARLVDSNVTVDEYRSKIGSDEEIVVLAFKVASKDPALDLVNFIEKSYEWVLDADASSCELTDGSYLVFVEMDRDRSVPENIVTMLEDISKLVDFEPEEWRIEYPKAKKSAELNRDSISAIIPLDPKTYTNLYARTNEDLDRLRTAAGVKVTTRAPVNDFTESLRIAAGIR